MATITAGAFSWHGTLAANQVDTVTLDGNYDDIEVTVVDSNDLSFTVAGSTTATQVDPVYRASGTFYVGPGASRQVADPFNAGPSQVRLISNVACAYYVCGSSR